METNTTMKDASSLNHKVVLVDYDADLFSPPDGLAEDYAKAGAVCIIAQYRDETEITEVTRDADVVMIQSVKPLLTGPVIREMRRCRCLIRLGTGFDSVDVATATAQGILVCNTPTYCVDDVAEHALALLLGATRHVSLQDRSIRAGEWDRRAARPARRLRGATLGLVAFGRIARGVAARAKGLGLRVLAADPFVDASTMAEHGVEKFDLHEMLRRSDFISVHAPLNDATRHLLGPREFEEVKPGAVLVNTSRGPVVDNEALAEALRVGRLWAAGLDVMEEEPLPPDSLLRALDNITFTPHVGASSEESAVDVYRISREIAVDVLNGRWPEFVVNPEVQSRYPLSGRG